MLVVDIKQYRITCPMRDQAEAMHEAVRLYLAIVLHNML